MVKLPGDDDALALRKAVEQGLDQSRPASVEFIVDVLDRSEKALVLERLGSAGYACDAWDDPVDKTLSIYAARTMRPTLEAIIKEKEQIRRLLAEFSVAVEDWGLALPPD